MHGKARCIENTEVLMILYKNIAWERGEFSVMVKMNIKGGQKYIFAFLSITTNCNKASIYNGLQGVTDSTRKLISYIN